MKLELQHVLDEIAKEAAIDPGLIYPDLQRATHLDANEVRIINLQLTNTAMLAKVFDFLKPKNETVFTTLQSIADKGKYEDFFVLIQTKLMEAGEQYQQLLFQPIYLRKLRVYKQTTMSSGENPPTAMPNYIRHPRSINQAKFEEVYQHSSSKCLGLRNKKKIIIVVIVIIIIILITGIITAVVTKQLTPTTPASAPAPRYVPHL